MTRIRATAAATLLFAACCGAAGVASADPGAPEPTPPPPAPAPGPAVAIDSDGLYTVGTDIQPGVYSSAGPLPGDTCYWKRVGPDDTVLQNALTKQPQVVAIEAGDVAFKTNGCQPWQPTDAAPPAPPPPWLSQLQLRHSLDVLNGLAGQSGNGQLPPY